ncbi:hypothetical protein NL676_019523 [Syzygium grande]|nr:hypothetical protein NL676_019523 [Syzygium grande]
MVHMQRKFMERHPSVQVVRDLPSERIEARARKHAMSERLPIPARISPSGFFPEKVERADNTQIVGVCGITDRRWDCACEVVVAGVETDGVVPGKDGDFAGEPVEAEVVDSELAAKKMADKGPDSRLRESLRWGREVNFPSDGKTVQIRRWPRRERRRTEREGATNKEGISSC